MIREECVYDLESFEPTKIKDIHASGTSQYFRNERVLDTLIKKLFWRDDAKLIVRLIREFVGVVYVVSIGRELCHRSKFKRTTPLKQRGSAILFGIVFLSSKFVFGQFFSARTIQ